MFTFPIPTLLAVIPQAAGTGGGTLMLVQTIALVVLALATVGLLVLFARVALEMRGMEQDVRSLVLEARERVEPVMDRAGNVADNVDYVSRVVREDVERLAATVERLRARLNQASDRMEERIEEFNALMEVAQSEAEEIFLDTASTVRGVREGTRAIREGRRSGPSPSDLRAGETPPPPEIAAEPEGGDGR